MEGMAIALYNRRSFKAAEHLARGLFEMREDLHGRYHPDTLQTATDLAIILLQQGKDEEADRIHETYEEGYDQALERREEVREEFEEGIAKLNLRGMRRKIGATAKRFLSKPLASYRYAKDLER